MKRKLISDCRIFLALLMFSSALACEAGNGARSDFQVSVVDNKEQGQSYSTIDSPSDSFSKRTTVSTPEIKTDNRDDVITLYCAGLFGMALTKSGYLREGAACLSLALEGNASAKAFSSLYAYRAAIYEHYKNWDAAIRDYRLCVVNSKQNIMSRLVMESLKTTNIQEYCNGRLIQCLWTRVEQSVKREKYEDAFRDCEAVLELKKDLPANVYYYIAVMAERARQPDLAEYYMKKSTEIDPKQKHALTVLGKMQNRAGKYVDAVNSYKSALKLDPSDIDTANKLVVLYLMLKQASNAANVLERYGARVLEDATLANNMACALMMMGNYTNAYKYASAAVNRNPLRDMYHYNCAIVLYKMSRHAECEEELRKWAMMVDPDAGLADLDAKTNLAAFENASFLLDIRHILMERKRKDIKQDAETIAVKSNIWSGEGRDVLIKSLNGEQGDGD